MKVKHIGFLSLAAGGIALVSGCIVEPAGRVAYRPVVVESPPPPVTIIAPPPPVVTVEVPDSYVWDGYEYVGVVGDQYYYLGPGSVWLVCEPFRLGRFHGWERYHADWRVHAIRNDRYRADHYGHVQPRREHDRRDDRR